MYSMYSMYFVCSYFLCPVYCSIDTNACQYVRIKKLLLLLLLIAITNSKFKKSTVSDMHYRIRYMHVKYQLNRDKRFVKTVITKNKLNCKIYNLQLELGKITTFRHALPPHGHSSQFLDQSALLDIEIPRKKNYFHRQQTDRQTDRQ